MGGRILCRSSLTSSATLPAMPSAKSHTSNGHQTPGSTSRSSSLIIITSIFKDGVDEIAIVLFEM